MTDRKAIQERRRRKKQQQRLTSVLVISGVALIIAAVLMLPTIRAAVTPVGEFVVPDPNPRPMADANTMGDPDAPVVIEEFSDFGCSHCADFALGTGELIAENYVATGQVYFVYRSAGGLLGHPNTPIAAEAAFCAGDQDKFWEYHDLLFTNQAALFGDLYAKIENTLEAYAETVGLNLESFNGCMDSGKYKNQVEQDEADALQAGIRSTPTFVINGISYVGNISFTEFESAIRTALASTGQ
jgi:protein-disulfide isomerase